MNEDDQEALQSEVEILSALSHEAITYLKEVFDTPKVIYMVGRVCSNSSVCHHHRVLR